MKKILILSLANFILLFLFSIHLLAQTKVIKVGYLFDSESGKFIKNQMITIENGKIKSVEK
ncbi:MAG: hypothetical protein KAR17_20655, partial [Cyclobacteriaceae bacterium]|nr:hypothetical protein [Cyclobacteriaceae bacterium]